MKNWSRILAAIVTLLVPVLLILASIWSLIHPAFLEFEYNLKKFPPDEFGFTTADRKLWGKLSIEYLRNSQDISFLENLKFNDGTPIYNERELSHMADVKSLVKLLNKILISAIIAIALLTLWAFKGRWQKKYFSALAAGGWLTLGLIGLILAGTLIDFDELFTQFHHLFFTGDTWLFYANDTLIRLFPLKLWSDAFIYMGVFTLLGIICVIIGGNLAARRMK